MSKVLVASVLLLAVVSSAAAKPLHETETCPEGQFYCAFISKCISSDLKCPASSKASSSEAGQKANTKHY